MDTDLISFAFPGVPRVRCVFTTRRGGVSRPPYDRANLSFDVGDDPAAVAANRRAIMRSLGFSHWQECRQVHGTAMRLDPEPRGPDDRPACEADGLATARPGQALVVKTADCQPILLAHASGAYVAALHAGWRGNVQDFPGVGVAAFCKRYGLDPADVHAVRGPSLGPTAAEFVHFEAEFGAGFREFHDPAARTVDLWALTRSQLMAAGLPESHIHGVDRCTATDRAFFSYRRDRDTGRQAGIIWMEE